MVDDTPPLVDYHDERTGVWTRYRIEPDRIVFVRGRSRPHWIAAALSVLILLALLVTVIRSPDFGGLPLLGFALVIFLAWLTQRKFDKTRFPLVISRVYESDLREMRRGRVFDASMVQQIVVRENSTRETDDSHLIQIYMQLAEADYLVHLHQDYYSASRANRINQVAEDLRSWLEDCASHPAQDSL